jgi:hypothetical protein
MFSTYTPMPTTTERRIAQRRRAQGVLVPILEDLLEQMVEIEDEDDIAFMNDLMRARMREREKGVFSPSMLSSCMRQAYFVKTGEEKQPPLSPQTNAYFLDGDFRHYKWQFALWKAHRAGKVYLVAVEERVYGQAGDLVGTIDAIVIIDKKVYIVDFKGMHLRAFQAFVRDGVTIGHGIQITGYGMIYGHQIVGGLLIGEAKPGPVQGQSPIALHEEFVPIRQFKSRVKNRLAKLRRYVDNEEIPPPACVSTRHFSFQECPFARHCLTEVRDIQRERERAARSDSARAKVAIPARARDDRPRGSRRK